MKTPFLRQILCVLILSINAAAAADLTGAWKLEFKPDLSGVRYSGTLDEKGTTIKGVWHIDVGWPTHILLLQCQCKEDGVICFPVQRQLKVSD